MTYFFKKPFAENGDITTIPVESQGEGYVSYDKGWEEGYELDPTQDPEDARNLSRTNFNGLFFNITSVLQEFQRMGANPYITASDNDGEPFPYPEGGLCYYTDPATNQTGIYRSIQSNNTQTPSTNGITGSQWQKIFSPELDTLKSNRVSNCPLYYTQYPTYTLDSVNNTITVTVYAGTKVLLPKGIADDGTLNTQILQLEDDQSITFTFDGTQVNKYFFINENQELVLIDTRNYCQYTSVGMVIGYYEEVTDFDVYYFDDEANVWKYRMAGSSTFVDLEEAIVNIGAFTGSSAANISFSYANPLELISVETLREQMDYTQRALEPTDKLSIKNTNQGTQVIDVNFPTTATPFCANAGYLNNSGNPELFSTQSVYKEGLLKTGIQFNSPNNIYSSGVPGSSYYDGSYVGVNLTCSEPSKCFAGYYTRAWFNWNYGSPIWNKVAAVTFKTPLELSTLGCYLYLECCNNYFYNYQPPHILQYGEFHFYIAIYFDDGGAADIITTEYGGYNIIIACKKDLTQRALWGSKITKIEVWVGGYMYNQAYSSWQWGIWSWADIANIQLFNKVNEIAYASQQIDFKVGANYYAKMKEAESSGATPMLSASTGTIKSNHSIMDGIWYQDAPIDVPVYLDEFTSTFEFNETPAETNNCTLIMRYYDNQNNQIFGGLKVELEYWGGTKYVTLMPKTCDRSEDMRLTFPNGKYIRKITVSASEMDYLNGVKFGKIQVWNNVPSATLSSLAKYPVLQGTAADTNRTHYTLMNVPSIEATTSGYLMMNANGVYILPGTNVIRKQKTRPSASSDPKLRTGDIWLDYSKEPLIAYQYGADGNWSICSDVPIGYVTLAYSNPSTTITPSTGLTATCDASTFAQQAGGTGTYTFTYSGTSWQYASADTTLSNWGITITSGTPTTSSTLQVLFTASETTIASIETYAYNQNGYDVNAFTTISGALVGRDGRNGVDGKDGKNGAPGPQGPAGVGIPTGGLTGQVLAKSSNANYATKWTTMASTALFDGGEAGMTLVKNSSADLDFGWGRVSGVPSGGTAGEVLKKNSSTDQDCSWGSVEALPQGGETGQVLVKLSNSNYNVGWTSMPNTMTLLNKSNFKIDSYFVGVVNSYTGLTLEQFINSSGINSSADDGATVISTYWSSQECKVTNSGNSAIAFRLNEITSETPMHFMQLEAETTGTVAFSYSIDGGTTFTSINKSTATQIESSSLIIKIQLQPTAVISNVAILVK